MNNKEVNQIIAEYMGWGFIDYDELPEVEHVSGTSVFDRENEILYRGNHFTLSLDALVPVWEKLEKHMATHNFTLRVGQGWQYEIRLAEYNSFHVGLGDTPQEAAAHATAKAIKELK